MEELQQRIQGIQARGGQPAQQRTAEKLAQRRVLEEELEDLEVLKLGP